MRSWLRVAPDPFTRDRCDPAAGWPHVEYCDRRFIRVGPVAVGAEGAMRFTGSSSPGLCGGAGERWDVIDPQELDLSHGAAMLLAVPAQTGPYVLHWWIETKLGREPGQNRWPVTKEWTGQPTRTVRCSSPTTATTRSRSWE